MTPLFFAIGCPAVLYMLGAWFETLGTIEAAADKFYSRWPLAAIGLALGAFTVWQGSLHL